MIADMYSFYEDICKLFELELYNDVITLYELSGIELSILTQQQLAAAAAITAESYYQCEIYAKSQETFYHAITIAKTLPKPQKDMKTNEAELKYRLHRCLLKQHKREEAIGVLGSIAENEMPPKARSALARLHVLTGNKEKEGAGDEKVENSLQYHMKVFEECPEAIDSLSCILRAGVKVPDLSAWRGTAYSWLKAQESVATCNYAEAVAHLSATPTSNLKVMVELGRLYYMLGENQKAIFYLQKAHHLDSSCAYSMDILAYILAQEQKQKELENLAGSLMDAEESPQAWIAYALLAKCHKRLDQALYFVQKACETVEWQVQPIAVLVKAIILMDKEKFDAAIQLLRDALIFNPTNFDFYEALVQSYMKQNKMHDARLAAFSCRHVLGQDNARALYLCATLAAKDDGTIKESQRLLEKAIALAPHLLDAVFLLVELYDRTQNYEKAITLLKKQSETTVNSRLHRLLGDFLSKTNRPVDACHQYRLAVDGDASAAQAMNALDGLAGLNTPEGLTSAMCPSAPRRRQPPQPDFNFVSERNV